MLFRKYKRKNKKKINKYVPRVEFVLIIRVRHNAGGKQYAHARPKPQNLVTRVIYTILPVVHARFANNSQNTYLFGCEIRIIRIGANVFCET